MKQTKTTRLILVYRHQNKNKLQGNVIVDFKGTVIERE